MNIIKRKLLKEIKEHLYKKEIEYNKTKIKFLPFFKLLPYKL